MERVVPWLGLLLLLAAAPGRAQEVPEPAPVIDELAIGEADLRMTVPATIDGSGPWPFVIDTGAERTVLSRELAARLAVGRGKAVRVTTMAGTASAETARVPSLRVSTLKPPAIEAPLFTRANLGAIGMLGLDALQGHSVRIDFDAGTMALRPSRKRRLRALPDEVVVTARSAYGQLIVTDARWRGKRIAVVLDTGSPVTIANPAMLRLARVPPPAIGPISVIAVTGETLVAQGYRFDDLEIGTIGFADVPVAVADAAPFHRFGLTDTPALLLGMETLRLFRMVDIDFPDRSIRFTLPRATVRRATNWG